MIIKAGDIKLYYERRGEGKPIILLHGNGESHEIFKELALGLEQHMEVFAPDSRGHGDSEAGELSYELMAEDIACFISELGLDKPLLMGFSDGGIIALLLAIKHPELLSGIIACGANVSPKGLKQWYRIAMSIGAFFTGDEKLKLMCREPHISSESLGGINVPTALFAGSRDMISEKHTRYIAKNIPQSELCILCGENHGSYVVHSDKLLPFILDFSEKL